MKLAFVFVIVGYGTKIGFVPMHSWLPDAHAEAPTPDQRFALGRPAQLRDVCGDAL